MATDSWLNWADEGNTRQLQQIQEAKTEDDQSIDSDHSDDFWHNWNPTIEKMILARRATYIQNLEAEIARDNLTFELLGKCFLDQRPVPTIEMKQFASIVLRDGLVDISRIEKQIAEDEAKLNQAEEDRYNNELVFDWNAPGWVKRSELEEQQDEPEEPPPTKPKPTKTPTLEKCSCGALLSKNKVAKHLKTRFHQEALDKRTPTEQLNDRLDKLENDIETAIAKAKEENKPKPPPPTPGPSENFFGQKQQPRATTPPPVRIVNLMKEKSPLATY